MEDLKALYSALEQADAAGDTEGAQQLADYIRSLPQEEPITTEEPSEVKTQPISTAQPPINVFGQQFTPEEYAKYSGMPIAAKPGEQAKGAFSGSFGRSIYNLAADLALAHGRATGNYDEAEATAKRLRDYGDNTYTSTTKGWKEDPLAKIQELAGGSAPYMIGPITAALGSTALGATGAAAVAAPLLTSAAQFTGSNLQRQMDQNKKLSDTSLLKAGALAIPQAALDQIGFRFIPGVKRLFGAAGKEISDQAAEELVKRSILSRAGETALNVGEGMTVEGATEAAQQLLERLQAGLSITNKEALDEYFQSFVGGAVLAGTIGLPGHVIETMANRPAAQAPTEKEVEEPEPPTEKRPSRETLKRRFFKDIKEQVDEANRVKAEEDAKKAQINLPTITQEGATADQGKLFNVVGGPSVEVGKPIITGVLDDTTLTSWGIRKGSNAFKALQGVDVSTEEGRDLMDKTLDAHTGKLNEDAINAYTNILDTQKEAPSGQPISQAVGISDAVSGQSQYGTPGGVEGRYGPTTTISGAPFEQFETRTKDINAPLETTKGPETLATGERLLSIQELLNDSNPQQRKAAKLSLLDYINRLNTNEVIKEGARLEREERAKYANLKKTEYPIVDQSTNLANILGTLKDKPNYLIEDLKNPDVPDAERQELNQHARDYLLTESLRNRFKPKMTAEERAALIKEGEEVAGKEKPLATHTLDELSEEDFKAMQEEFLAQQAQEPLEARAPVIEGTGETPDTIETAFQKQYGKNVRLAKQRGLLNFLNDVSELPPEIGKVSPNTKAVYHKGKGYFITNRITKEDAPRMLLHEIGAHYGLEGMLGTANFKRVVKQIKQNHLTDKELKAAWENTLKTYPEYTEGGSSFMQEVIANIGETAPNNTIWRQIMGYIKQFLSKLGYGWNIDKITADDIRDMVQHSVRVALRGETTEAKGDLAMAAEEAGAVRPTYYSQLTRVITNAQFKNNVSLQSGEQWVNWLNSKTSEAGVKRDELEFSGLIEFLELNKDEKFNKQDILNYLEDNGTKVTEYTYGEGADSAYSDKEREEWVEQGVSEWIDSQPDQWEIANLQAADDYPFPYYVKEENVTDAEGNKAWRVYDENYKTPVDDTYYFSEEEAQDVADDFTRQGLDEYAEAIHDRLMRDLYDTADVVRDEYYDQWDSDHEEQKTRYLDWTLEGGDKKYTEVIIGFANPKKGMVFSHQHWPDIQNPIAHYRVNARTDTTGANVLFVEEIQSDWAQAPKKLRKKHIKELAQKYNVKPEQMAPFVPGDWGFKRKFTPEQEKEYDNIITQLKEFIDARSKLSLEISKLIAFEGKLYQFIDYEIRKRIGPKDSNEREFDMTRTDYLADVIRRRLNERTTASGYKIDTSVVKEILDIPGVKENLDQRDKNEDAKNKLIYKEDMLDQKITDLKAKKEALSQSGKIDRAPFVQDTEAWSNLVLKNIIRFAAERGYDKVAFVNGKQAAFKGGKADRIDEVFGTKNDDGTYNIYATLEDGGGRSNTLKNIRDLDLEDYVGGLADKFRGLKVGETDGWDAGELKLPAQGMVEFYDHYIPRYAAKLIKKLGGGSLEKIELVAPYQDRPEDEKVGIQTGFTLNSAMKDKAMAGQPLFARANKQDLDDLLKKSGTVGKIDKEEPTLKDRFMEAPLKTVDELVADFRKSFFSFDAAINNKMLIAMRQRGLPEKEIAKVIYETSVSQAVKADQVADMWMVHGGVSYDPESFNFVIKDLPNSFYTIRTKLNELAKKYGKSEYEMYQYGNAAFVSKRSLDLSRRNTRLKRKVKSLLAQGKEKAAIDLVDTHYKLVHQTPAQIKDGLEFFNEIPELKKIQKIWNINRERLLDFAVKNGLYTRDRADELLDVIDYVPFFRDKQIEARKGPNTFKRGLIDAAVDKHLKGSYQPVHNVFANMELWSRYILKKSINNRIAQAKIKYYSKFIPDDIKILRSDRTATGNVVGVWQNGKVVRYEFQGYDGASMVDGFTGLEPAAQAWLFPIFRPFARILRAQIVLEPIFNVGQIAMDAFNGWFASQVNFGVMVPLQAVKEVFLTPMGLSTARKYLTARATTGKHDFASEYDQIDIKGMQEVKEVSKKGKLIEYVLAPAKALVHGFKFLGMVSDNIIRQAVWSQVYLETKDKARATYVANEIINFRRTGSSGLINNLRQNAPFVNANLQSMNIAYGTIMLSGITPDSKMVQLRRLVFNAAQFMSVVLIYTLLNADDDDYKKLDPRDRDSSWMIPGTGGFKLPLRKDIITALFKSVPEHIINRYLTESEDSEKLKQGLKFAFQRALAMPSMLPTYATPAVERYMNYDFVTGRPLVGRGQENLEPDLQYSNKYTSQLARWANDATGVSPATVQLFMNRWLASTSMLIGLFTNKMIADIRGEILPEKTTREELLQIPNMSMFLAKPENTRNLNDLYELKDLVDSVVTSANKYESLGDHEKFREYLAKNNNQQLYNLKKELAIITRDLSNLRKWENRVYYDKDPSRWTPQSKKEELDRIEAAKQTILGHEQSLKDSIDRRIQNLRKQGGL